MLYSLSDKQRSSWWWKHFVLFLKPLKLTFSEGGDVMWNEWFLFLSNFTILERNLIFCLVSIKDHYPHPTPLPATHITPPSHTYTHPYLFFNKGHLIDQKYVFFLPLCSGQWAHAMFIGLKISHCDEEKKVKKEMQKRNRHWQHFLCRSFFFMTNWDQITVAPERGRIDLSVLESSSMSYSIYDNHLHLCLIINMTPVHFMAGVKQQPIVI